MTFQEIGKSYQKGDYDEGEADDYGEAAIVTAKQRGFLFLVDFLFLVSTAQVFRCLPTETAPAHDYHYYP